MIGLINDEDAIMIVINRKAPWPVEVAWLVTILAELGHEREAIIIIAREYLHSIVAAIDDKQEASMMVEHQAIRAVEQAISIALLLGADRELDSSITIKSIVFHLLPIQSLPLFTRATRDTRDSKRATRSNKNQSMKEA